jgi:hypothetical protein
MMNKSLRGGDRESSHKVCYGFHELRSFDNRRTSVRFRACRSVFGRSECVRLKKCLKTRIQSPVLMQFEPKSFFDQKGFWAL